MPWLLTSSGVRLVLEGDTVTIGRDEGNDVTLRDDPKVSRSHALFERQRDQWTVRDLHSKNGTWVNGRTVSHRVLRDGDRIRLGATSLRYGAPSDPNATEADAPAPLPAVQLSNRERQVLALVAEGLTDAALAVRLAITTSTVRSHLDRIREKTGLRRRSELTRLAISLGLLGEDHKEGDGGDGPRRH